AGSCFHPLLMHHERSRLQILLGDLSVCVTLRHLDRVSTRPVTPKAGHPSAAGGSKQTKPSGVVAAVEVEQEDIRVVAGVPVGGASDFADRAPSRVPHSARKRDSRRQEIVEAGVANLARTVGVPASDRLGLPDSQDERLAQAYDEAESPLERLRAAQR